MRLGLALLGLGIAVAACGGPAERAEAPEVAETADPDQALVPARQQNAQTGGGRETVSASQATIDWATARRDLASRGQSDDIATFQIESGPAAPPVPVLLPTGIVRAANADRPRYRPLNDGYYAKYPGIDYDIVISGTNEWYSRGSNAWTEPAEEIVFTRTMTGAQIALNRYGAAYLVEFECKGRAGALASPCITEDEAMQVAQNLVITGTR